MPGIGLGFWLEWLQSDHLKWDGWSKLCLVMSRRWFFLLFPFQKSATAVLLEAVHVRLSGMTPVLENGHMLQ